MNNNLETDTLYKKADRLKKISVEISSAKQLTKKEQEIIKNYIDAEGDENLALEHLQNELATPQKIIEYQFDGNIEDLINDIQNKTQNVISFQTRKADQTILPKSFYGLKPEERDLFEEIAGQEDGKKTVASILSELGTKKTLNSGIQTTYELPPTIRESEFLNSYLSKR